MCSISEQLSLVSEYKNGYTMHIIRVNGGLRDMSHIADVKHWYSSMYIYDLARFYRLFTRLVSRLTETV